MVVTVSVPVALVAVVTAEAVATWRKSVLSSFDMHHCSMYSPPEPAAVLEPPPTATPAARRQSAIEPFLQTQVILTGAVGSTVRDDRCGDLGRTTGGVGAVTNTVSEVGIFAEAGRVGRRASKGWGEGEHVVDAGLLESG